MTCHLKHCTLWVFVILCIVKGRTCACSRARVFVCICHCHDRVLSANSNSNWDIIYTLFELVVSFANFRMKHSFSFSLLYGQWRSSRRTKFVFDNLFSIFLFQVLQMIVIAELDFFFTPHSAIITIWTWVYFMHPLQWFLFCVFWCEWDMSNGIYFNQKIEGTEIRMMKKANRRFWNDWMREWKKRNDTTWNERPKA